MVFQYQDQIHPIKNLLDNYVTFYLICTETGDNTKKKKLLIVPNISGAEIKV